MRKCKTGPVYFVCFAALMLVVQLVITSGHIHLDGSSRDHGLALAAGGPDGGDHFPGKPHPGHDDFCALCWAKVAAGCLLVPPAASVLPPASIACSPTRLLSARLDAFPRSSAFDPRAPPLGDGALAALGKGSAPSV